MYLVRLVLTNPDLPQPDSMAAERILDALWAHLEPRFGIEHIRARAGPAGINLGLFFRDNESDAETNSATAIADLLACIPEWKPEIPP
ncbi:hypothetical protein ACFOSC_16865 [Streptantibioticus rubrisoli]|uniref:DNA damage-inducible protein I n=1 Tax=Streptantibioticus rubrisoli TaxID=1387313 RepID=A0ABT1PGV5_9ACTN|nr:hypothetical protein [Streptantibioticus rubrisoli]MCQ4044601.1 hypothetical protein [Streptantibioticus rubrisoli]